MSRKKLQVWLPLIFSIVMILGMMFGFKLHQQTGSVRGFFVRDRRSSLQEALDLIQNRYVDSVKMDSLQDDALEGLMSRLDPHSVYIPAREYGEANEDLVGNFDGIGVEFNIFSDTVHIQYVIPNGPGDKAGLRVGDRITAVDDKSIVSKTLPSEDIRRMIRGKAGTQVKLTIFRNQTTQFIYAKRGTIPLPSLDAYYLLDSATGYIKLSKFSETTYQEFMSAMERLKAGGMKSLMLDLRSNGGGLMSQAIAIADEFLDGDKLIVYTQGTNTERQEYRARKEGVFEQGKLAVIVDELSASASEILAGALQDWDRATIVGRRTFGKGLVQEQYQLSDGSAIRLTVSRYFTPLGRSIQRPYDQGKKLYMEEIYGRYSSGEMLTADSIHNNKSQAYKTSKGRTVYGGGGIVPDAFVPIDTSLISRSVTRLYLDGRFNNFVYQYYIQNQAQLQQYKTPSEFAAKYNKLDDAWSYLVTYAAKDSINLKNIAARDRIEIQEQMKAYLARFRWRTQGFYEVRAQYDDAIAKARQVLKASNP